MKKVLVYSFLVFFLVGCKNENKMDSKNKSLKNMESKESKQFNYFEYYENNKIRLRAKKADEVFHGRYEEFYKNGNLKLSGAMNSDKKVSVWRNFEEEGNLKSVNLYKADSIINTFGPKNFELSYTKIKGLEIKVPTSWITDKNIDSTVLLTSRKNCKDKSSFCPNYSLQLYNLIDLNLSFEEFINLNLKKMNNQSSFFKVIDQGTPPYEKKAFQVIYILKSKNNYKLAGVSTFIQINDFVFIITGMAPNEEEDEFIEYKVLFQEISGSLRKKSN